MIFLRQIACLLLGWTCAAHLRAAVDVRLLPNADPEAGRLFARAFAPREYQGGHAVLAVTQGSDGVVYLGCLDAVVAYDGQAWSRYVVPGAVVSLAADENGNVFIATENGFHLLQRQPLGRRAVVPLQRPLAKANQAFRPWRCVWSLFCRMA